MTDDPPPQVRPGFAAGRREVARAGIVVAAVLILVVGAAAANGASPGTGANPSAAAPSAKVDRDGDTNKDKSDHGPRWKLGDLGLPGLKFDKGDRGEKGGRRITITSITGSNVSLKTDDGWTRTVALTADTKVFVGSQVGKAGDLKVGDQVRLRQQRNDDGTFTVLALVVVPPTAAGSVTAVGADSITVTRRGGSSTTIAVNGSTKFQVGKSNASKSDVHVGSRIVAEGTGSADSLTATLVRIEPTFASGEVTAKTATSITIKQRDGTSLTIHVDANTTYRVRGAATKPGTLADIKVGDRLVAAGTPRADKSLDAIAVGAGAAKTEKPETELPDG